MDNRCWPTPTDQEFESLAKGVARAIVGGATDVAAIKTLWRLARGCRDLAFKIIRGHGKYFPSGMVAELMEDDTFCEIICAEIIGGGCEVEWAFATIAEYQASKQEEMT